MNNNKRSHLDDARYNIEYPIQVNNHSIIISENNAKNPNYHSNNFTLGYPNQINVDNTSLDVDATSYPGYLVIPPEEILPYSKQYSSTLSNASLQVGTTMNTRTDQPNKKEKKLYNHDSTYIIDASNCCSPMETIVLDEQRMDESGILPINTSISTRKLNHQPISSNYYGLPNKLQKEIIEDNFSTMVVDSPTSRVIPLVVLDCANIGWCYGIHRFNVHGVITAIDYFKQLQIEVQAFIPASYLRIKPTSIDDSRENAMMITEEVELLTQLANDAIVTIVPAGDYDDAYILNYARDYNGFIISNDLFKDHLASIQSEATRFSMSTWLHEHRCGYTFVAVNRSHNVSQEPIIASHNNLQQQQQQQIESNNNVEFLFNQSSKLRLAIERYHYQRHPYEYRYKQYGAIDQMIEQISHMIHELIQIHNHITSSDNPTPTNNNDNDRMKMEMKWLFLTRASLQLKV